VLINLCICCFLDPQKQYADAVIEVLPTQLIPDDNEGKILRVRLIQKEGVKYFSPVYLFDEGSTISWIPCGRKLTCSYPGIKFFYGPESYKGNEVSTSLFFKYSINFIFSIFFIYHNLG
jgi:phosphoribulokinase